MRKMVGVLIAVVLLLAMTGGPAWAQGADPLGVITGAALMPYFNVSPGNLFFLLLATPNADNANITNQPNFDTSTSHIWFYNTGCVRQESIFVPQTENDTDAILLNGKTSATEGAVLIAGTDNGINQLPLFASIFARGVWLDVTADHARVVDPAAMSVMAMNAQTADPDPATAGNQGLQIARGEIVGTQGAAVFEPAIWSPYDTGGALIFMPPDDGSSFFDRVIFSCPSATGSLGLSGSMAALVALNSFNGEFWPNQNLPTLQAVVSDDEETPLVDWTFPCRCVGLNIAGTFVNNPRLSAINPLYATNTTYTEIRSTTGTSISPRFTGYWNVEVHIGGNNMDVFGRIAHGPAETDTGMSGLFQSGQP